MKIKSQKDFFSGLMFLVVGGAFAWGASNYNVGTGARMGPGYFPMMLGFLLCGLGSLIMFQAMVSGGETGDKIGKWAWKPISFILGANVIFGILLGGLPSLKIPSFGLIISIYALVIVASLAGERFKIKPILILATILAIGSYAAFIKLLNLQMPVWPTFITG